jgi:hypothetical protein
MIHDVIFGEVSVGGVVISLKKIVGERESDMSDASIVTDSIFK